VILASRQASADTFASVLEVPPIMAVALVPLDFTPEVQRKMVDGLYEEAQGRSIQNLATECDALLRALLKARQGRA